MSPAPTRDEPAPSPSRYAPAVLINNADFDFNTSWGGYKQSGNGRRWAAFGSSEYPETKSIVCVIA
ncbi:hypothetical protein [Streptomyces sp. ITFR-16]|uniref:hypothetical protein n=1 Tax=Streptomyces sp. ITFR-16 TaxID=3075198 RepID=UPI002889E105|nr:hypothetical protein [Streptomyces sp. ITFR-16]WNI27158.1 hypothetical protein RLT58_34845 [Streptomyces sp. ITFR-16]